MTKLRTSEWNFVGYIVGLPVDARPTARIGLWRSGRIWSVFAPRFHPAGKKLVHRTIFEKAAAYGFHVCRNHPFVDGNKRVALVLMDVFLERNGWTLSAPGREAYTVMMELAAGLITKRQLATWLKRHSHKSPA